MAIMAGIPIGYNLYARTPVLTPTNEAPTGTPTASGGLTASSAPTASSPASGVEIWYSEEEVKAAISKAQKELEKLDKKLTDLLQTLSEYQNKTQGFTKEHGEDKSTWSQQQIKDFKNLEVKASTIRKSIADVQVQRNFYENEISFWKQYNNN